MARLFGIQMAFKYQTIWHQSLFNHLNTELVYSYPLCINLSSFCTINFKPKQNFSELRKKEKDNRRLQQELTMEKEKFNQMVGKYTKDLQDLQATLYEESQARLKLSMELDTKESDLETLQNKLAHINLDTASLSSGTGDFGDPLGSDGPLMTGEHSLEGWLQVTMGHPS